MRLKKYIVMGLALSMCVSCVQPAGKIVYAKENHFGVNANIYSADKVTSGKCGENLTYTIVTENEKTILTIEGTGPMYDYYLGNDEDETEDFVAPWDWWENDIYLDEVVIGEGVTTIGERAFRYQNRLKSITLPSSIKEIHANAFYDCGIEGIILPESLQKIGDSAFERCENLKEVECPNSVISLGYSVFEKCKSLTRIKFPKLLKSINESMCQDCVSLKTVILPVKLNNIEEMAFDGCKELEKIELPETLKTIDSNAFSDCVKLTDIKIPASVQRIDGRAFYGCKSLKSINLPAGIKKISYGLFYGCTNLETIEIPTGVLKIEENAFKGCTQLKSVKLPDSLTTIYEEAFYNCSSLREISIPKSVGAIGENALGKQLLMFNDKPTIIPGFVIVGYKGTTAEKYAKDNNITFKCLDVVPHSHTYKDVIKKATLTTAGSITKVCSGCGAKASETVIDSLSNITIDKTKYTYNGKIQKPTVVVKDKSGKIVDIKNYTVTYDNNCSQVGMHNVVIKFTSDYYDGSKTLTYTIIPKKTAIKSIKSKNGNLTVGWSKIDKQITGYELQYSTSSDFKSSKKVAIKGSKNITKTIKNLKLGKKYYVRIRTYKTVNSKKYYSNWSASKSTTIK